MASALLAVAMKILLLEPCASHMDTKQSSELGRQV